MYSVNDSNNLPIDKIWELYGKHVNSSQVKLFKRFSFSNDLVESALGSWITLTNQRKILDLTGGIGVLNHGHNHPRIIKARNEFISKNKMEVHKNFFSPYIAALSSNISEILPGDLNYSFYCNSGAEAVEGAVKLAFKFHEGKRKYILHSDISFHGKLLGASGLTGSPENHFRFPTINNIRNFRYNDISSVESIIEELRDLNGTSEIYALIVEPLNASTMLNCSDEFLKRLRELTEKEGICLIFDEVYTGWAKTGWLFNFMRVEGLVPDILTYAKSFGGGKSSISGYSYRNKLARAYDNLKDATLHSTTYNGFGEETITAIEAINIVIEEEFIEKGKVVENRIKTEILPLVKDSKLVKEIRGSGALWGLILNDTFFESIFKVAKGLIPKRSIFNDDRFLKKLMAGSVVEYLYSEHNILTYIGYNVENPVIISFPLVSTKNDIDYAMEKIKLLLNNNGNEILLKFFKKQITNMGT